MKTFSLLYAVLVGISLLLATALHGSWSVMLGVRASVMFFYGLAVMPGLLEAGTGERTSRPRSSTGWGRWR